ncbi:NmrA family transcriptional regulator [Mycolicibacterium madagascariense]|uniref:NmrA family transcriptional regulator n=1 Tax=Mycolicibacterium madagascariense TaxID=212765 RepID=A0A7I7XJB6_9MYCO|nr:NmrA family NAD(P)-binding protein [Mycolicibacterium madagascariense]MCV7015109.1 NmrA family NAD(P)-binding protein [Mycolicibacterium madagascariense]BBZ29306.1 NmrA family transcriptional regulator [Mycolicibacterium madagascariense]
MTTAHHQPTTTLVIGATGRHGGTGGQVVHRLLQAGQTVRALVRSDDDRAAKLRTAGVHTVVGDVLDRRTIVPVIDGVDAVYLAYPAAHGVLDALLNIASLLTERASSAHVVIMSMGAADHASPSGIARGHALAEETLLHLGVNVTAVRGSAFFYENLTALHAHQIATTGVLSNPFGDSRPAWVSGVDIAHVCAQVLLKPQRYATTPILHPPGTERHSQQDIAQLIGDEVGRDIRYEYVPAAQWRRELEAFLPPAVAEHLSEMARMCEDGTTLLRPDVDPDYLHAASGQPPQTLRDFIHDHRSAFQPVGTPA